MQVNAAGTRVSAPLRGNNGGVCPGEARDSLSVLQPFQHHRELPHALQFCYVQGGRVPERKRGRTPAAWQVWEKGKVAISLACRGHHPRQARC